MSQDSGGTGVGRGSIILSIQQMEEEEEEEEVLPSSKRRGDTQSSQGTYT